jgi:hypothetical protein
MASCPSEDNGCIQYCANQGSSQAIDQMNDLINCYYGNTCESFFDYECMANQCPYEYDACIR